MADELFTPDYVNHHGVSSDLVTGPRGDQISAGLHRVALPDLRVVVEEAGAVEDIVVFGWTAGNGPGASPAVKGITRARFVDGQIAESWTEWEQIDA